MEWSEVYNKYRVVSSKITIRHAPVAGSNVAQMIYGVCLANNTSAFSAYTSFNSVLESNLVGDNWRVTSAAQPAWTGNSMYGQMSKSYNAKRFLGVDPLSIVGTSITANPATDQDAFFIVFGLPPDGASNPGANNFVVQIDYVADFSEPKNMDGS